jgi:oxygen-independent coproporphyrinogen-3 oxidase
MHRTHTAEQVPVAVHVLRDAGFGNLSLDLIFALPASLGRNWKADLERALALEPDHLSVYGLTLEPHTPFAHWIERGECRPPADERYAQEFLEAHSRLSPAGFEHYEVSNYARPGMASRHNSAYWTRAPYLGLGPSAHSAMGDERRWNLREWSAFERALAGRDSPIEGREVVSPEGRRLEELYLGLRTRSGVAQEQVPSRMAALWQEQGWAHLEAGNLRLTPEGWLRVDSLVLAVRNRAELSPALR